MDAHNSVKLELDVPGGDYDYHMLVKEAHMTALHEMDVTGNNYDYHVDMKVENTSQVKTKKVDSRKSSASIIDSHQTVKHEIDATDNICDYHMDMEVKEHPIQEDLKQEVENCPNLSLSDDNDNKNIDLYCRICGIESKVNPFKSTDQNILAWMYPLQDFNANTQGLCQACCTIIKPHHRREYSQSKGGRHPKKRISVTVWDHDGQCPVYHKDEVPYRYSVTRNRRLNGKFRSIKEPMADNEVVYPEMV